MNGNFHISRYQVLMMLIGIIFIFIVIKALTFLPEEQNDAQLMQNAKNKEVAEMEEQQEDVIIHTNDNIVKHDEVSENTEEHATVRTTSTIDNMLAEAEQNSLNENYQKALSIYFDVVNMTDDIQKYAVCYDGISRIYAAQNKYEKAIEKAQLAYKYEPTDMRKLTLAKLYHRVGNTDMAQTLIHELLEN